MMMNAQKGSLAPNHNCMLKDITSASGFFKGASSGDGLLEPSRPTAQLAQLDRGPTKFMDPFENLPFIMISSEEVDESHL